MRKWKDLDPDPYPYIWLMDPDPDPQHCFAECTLLGCEGEKAVMIFEGADRAGQDRSDECGVWRGRHPRQSLQQLR